LENLIQPPKQLCLAENTAPKLMSLPRMISPAQFCPVPEGQRTAKSLKSCWENYLRNPETYLKNLEACSAPPAEEDFAAQEPSSNIPPEMFHFLSRAAR
ncbi:MAG: hypothetical protein AB7P20_25120, partial [Rhizobiaceae bacterium]